MEARFMKHRFDDIIKSESDDRSYRGLILNNYMKVLLISDPTIDKAAAALDVNIGSMSDPDHLPGLAHLLQHVLYLSEEKTPQKKFKAHVSQNNGVVNARTTENHTNYHFDIAVSEFKNALTLFAEIFINSVVFTKDMIRPELKYLNIDYEMNSGTDKYDKWGLTQLFKWTIDRYHPISKFGTTFSNATTSLEIETLLSNAEKELQRFYNSHYSSHIMSVCVLSKETLDELEKLVVNLFSQIKLKNVFNSFQMQIRQFSPTPKCPSVYKIWGAHCNTDYKRLYIIFPVDNLLNYHQSAPERFLTYLFEYNGKGSLMSVLKAKDWGNTIEAGSLCPSNYYSFFIVAVELTDEGLEHIDDIMTLFFQYVKMLKEGGGEFRRIYNEYKEIMELKFRFKEKEPSLKYVKMISRMLQSKQTMKNILCLEHIPIKYERFIESVMNDFLSPPRMRIYIIAKKYQDFADEYEPRYHFAYRKEMVPMKTCASWTNNACANLNLPACNEFIPTMTNIKPCEDNAEKFPTVIWDTQLVRVWHKKDDMFNEPRTIMIFHFICPLAYADLVNANFTLLFVRLINNSLREYLYPAALVDLRWELCATVYGIVLKINGFDDKQYVLLEKIVDRMINFKLSLKNFEVDKQNHEQFCKMQLEQFKNDEPYRQVQHYLSIHLNSHLLPKDQILEASAHITFEKVQQFISNIFDSVYVECLIHGNMTKAEALDIVHLIENKLPHAIPLTLTHLEMHHDVNDGYHFVCHRTNEFRKSSCIQLFYKINERSIQSDVLLDLVQQIINKPCYDTLNTEKKLGYIACTGIHRANRIQGLKILVQSSKSQIDGNTWIIINAFAHSMLNYIINMSEKSFQENKALLARSYHDKKPKTLNDLSSVFWAEILNQQYNFDRTNAKVDYLEKITMHDLSIFFEKLIDDKTSKVSVYM
ncbi:insulin-degrading enzyme-like isoform X1 [Formica exsecta]|uniref:insulin-degrading enzyme-like isoform X1 n=1 Tax=Formica exsecta TaxID=72781 RepID=UPI0011414CCF|nr:insulin-degrading enzyme-like isoform X1 [Formica exsecta]XP_029680920.1 insulin-degrading enzyme-like isoform X1 [Formica exsecta]